MLIQGLTSLKNFASEASLKFRFLENFWRTIEDFNLGKDRLKHFVFLQLIMV